VLKKKKTKKKKKKRKRKKRKKNKKKKKKKKKKKLSQFEFLRTRYCLQENDKTSYEGTESTDCRQN
jgi:hypothetical protein